MSIVTEPLRASLVRHRQLGNLVTLLLVCGLGGFAAVIEVASAVVASGSLVVQSNSQKVQHPTGGVVGQIHAREGDRVRAGDVLLKLDDTAIRASLAIADANLVAQQARKIRLEAERTDLDAPGFPGVLGPRKIEAAVADIIAGEIQLFQMRRRARLGQKLQLTERRAQVEQEAAGLKGQLKIKATELSLVKTELDATEKLWQQNLTVLAKLTNLKRTEVRLEGERVALESSIVQLQGKATEISFQIAQIDRDHSTEVTRDLLETETKIAEFAEKKITADDQLARVAVRAPYGGIVHNATIHTVGGVIGAAETIMVIVPDAEALVAEVRIHPHEIERMQPGLPVTIRFPALNQRTTPEIIGSVERVAPDVTIDQRTGAVHYTLRLRADPIELARLGSQVRLVAGMPVEAFIKTGDRTILSYLMKPLLDQMSRAFRER